MQLLMLSLSTHEIYNCPVRHLEMQGIKYAIQSPPMNLPPIIRLSRFQFRSDPIVQACTLYNDGA